MRDLAARGADWRFYDSQFRPLRQSNLTEFPWGSTHWELWIRAQHFNNARFSKAQMPAPVRHNSSNAGSIVPIDFCCKFHWGLIARAAVLNINVLNVVSFTLHCGVIFVLNSPPLNQPQLLRNHALPTPVQIEKLRPLLCVYVAALTSILCDGFTFGFPLHFKGDRISFFSTNLISAQQNPEIVSAKISKELAAGRLAGHFDSPPFPNFRMSP